MRAEQVRLFYKGIGFGALATLLLGWAIAQTAGGFVNDVVLIWSVAIGLVSVCQLVLWHLWQNARPGQSASWDWQYYPLPLSLFAGLCWGAAAIYPYPDYSEGLDLLLVLIVAGGVHLMLLLQSPLLSAMVFFVLGLLVPVAMALLSSSERPPADHIIVMSAAVTLISLTTLAVSRLMMLISSQRADAECRELMLLQSGEQAGETGGEESFERQPIIEGPDSGRGDLERELFLEKEAAESAATARSEFLATMSHEIRTPLNSIVPVLEMLKDTGLDQEQKQFVATALASSQQLLSIINDILDFSKIEAGRLEVEKIAFDVWELVNSVATVMLGAAKKKNLDLQYLVSNDVPPKILGDPNRLRQVLVNLVSNAIKFTDKGSITLEVSLDRERWIGEWLMFSVTDTGIGMSSDTIPKLFQSFSQADASTTRRYGGTGLGLVISKGLVELLGGRISVQSEPGVGSVFWFVLPLERSMAVEGVSDASQGSQIISGPESDAVLPAQQEEPVLQKVSEEPRLSGRVLVVEDNPVNLGVSRKMLQRMGLNCDTVTNGQSAVTAASGYTYDVILMGCQMPIMDGYEATQLIRQRERSKGMPQVPIIAMTANAMAGDREKCIKAGMDDYLSKPVLLDTMRKTLGYWLSVHRSSKPVEYGHRRITRSFSSKQGKVDEPEEIPHIMDIKILRELQLVMGNEFIGLIESYLAHAPLLMGEIKTGIEAGDLNQVIRPAYSLKSSSANVGALRLSTAAGEMEENARAGEQDKVIAGLAGLELEHEVSSRVLMNIDKKFFE